MDAKKEAPEGAPSISIKNSHKDTVRKTQMQMFFEYLRNNVATCSMVCDATGLKQKCCTRYKRLLEENGLLFEVYDGDCKSTGFKAAYLTTNRELMPKLPVQLSLFD